MLFAPGGNFVVVYFPEPDVILIVAKTVLPLRYSILPVGVPANDATVAVNVTDLPCTEGLTDASRVVVVVAFDTTCDNVLDVLPVKLVSPP